MSFHINFQGQVGRCTARVACPFGDFDTQHYTTQEQAQAAYEAMNKGEEVASALSKEVYFEEKAKANVAQSEAEKERAKYRKSLDKAQAKLQKKRAQWLKERQDFVAKMRLPATRVPPPVEPGYFKTVYGPEVGEPSPHGGIVVEVGTPAPSGTVYVKAKDGDVTYTYSEELGDTAERQVWVDEPDPELVAVREAAIKEHAIEDFYLNHRDFKNGVGLRRSIELSEREGRRVKWLLKDLRVFNEKIEEFRKSGVASPHTRAYEAAMVSPGVDKQRASAFSLVVLGKEVSGSSYSPYYSSMAARATASYVYPKDSFSLPEYREALLQEREELENKLKDS